MFPKKYLPEDKIRQKICQGSPELRALASKLEQAYINKERAAQVAERNLQLQEEKLARDREQEEQENQRLYLEQEEKREYRDDQIKKLQYQKQLDEQMKLAQEQREKLFQQFLEERRLIDQIVGRMQREQEEAVLKRLCARQASHQVIQEFKRGQEVWRERERERREREEAQIRQFLEYKETRDKELELTRNSRREAKNETVMRLAEDIMREEREKREKEEILQELYEGRIREEEKRKEEEEMEIEMRRRLQLREAHHLAAEYRREREERERREEEDWRGKMMEKFAEDDKLEQMNEQRRRMKREEHRRSVEGMLEQRRIDRKKEAAAEAEWWAEARREEAESRRILEEERERLLQQHLARVLPHLPKGVLNQEDFKTLGERFSLATGRTHTDTDQLAQLERKYT